jgi:ferredoxin-NADP reductase
VTERSPSSPWQTATVVGIAPETARAKTFRLALEQPTGHRAGQHYVVRLTAPDGYTASRSYSVASAPGDPSSIELTVERLEEGEVSTFLHDVVEVGDELEVRGPIGGWFTWDGDAPALALGGGAGLVPLMSMLRLARARGVGDRFRLLVSVRSPADLLYADELPGAEVTVLYTRAAPDGWPRAAGRLALADLAELADLAGLSADGDLTAYVCGSSGFVEAASHLLLDIGLQADQVRIERFGPT